MFTLYLLLTLSLSSLSRPLSPCAPDRSVRVPTVDCEGISRLTRPDADDCEVISVKSMSRTTPSFSSRQDRSLAGTDHKIVIQFFLSFHSHIGTGVIQEVLVGKMNELFQGGKTLLDRHVKIVEFTVSTIGDPFSSLITMDRFTTHGDHIDGIFLSFVRTDT